MTPDESLMVGARFTGSPLTKCAPAHTQPEPTRPPINGRLLASGVAWDTIKPKGHNAWKRR